MIVNLANETDARYAESLDALLASLNAEKILSLQYECDYQGHVDIDVLLKDGRVFSYYYSYGSCSGCDSWEASGYGDEEVQREMLQEATFFTDMNSYKTWLKMKDKTLKRTNDSSLQELKDRQAEKDKVDPIERIDSLLIDE